MARYTGNTGNISMATPNRGLASQGNVQSIQQQIQTQAQILADQMLAEMQLAEEQASIGKIFTNFGTGDIRGEYEEVVTKGLFSGNTGSLTEMFTSSLLSQTQKSYYAEIFSKNDPAISSMASPELSIAYGHFNGSGSVDVTGNLNNDTPSRAIYRQYAQLLLAPNDKKFTFNGVDSDSIYILNFNRARIREKIDPGNFEVTFAEIKNDVENNEHTSSNVVIQTSSPKTIQVIDDSSLNDPAAGEGGLVYNLVSGSIDGGTSIHTPDTPVHYGLLFPQHGVAIFNANQLDKLEGDGGMNFGTTTGSQVQGENHMKMFHSISGSQLLVDTSLKSGGIQARSSEKITATYYFVRVKNGDYNYSNNPTFTTGSLGEVSFASFAADPQVFITTIGLYNSARELLAVAKLSQPLLKSFTREALIKVKLDF